MIAENEKVQSGHILAPGGRSIPSLDGLRAVSVVMVLRNHMNFKDPPDTRPSHRLFSIFAQGNLGVSIFFVISGFLITTLLLNEIEKTGRIDLGRFYFRRSLRIFPPYYVYLLVAGIVAVMQMHPIPAGAMWSSALYVSNYFPYVHSQPGGIGWFVGHTWSLSVEEQFYLFWPALLLLLSRKKALTVAVASLAVVPFLRLATYYLLPIYHDEGQTFRLFHTTFDILMTGCVLAFLIRDAGFAARMRRLFRWFLLTPAILYLAFYSLSMKYEPVWFQGLFAISAASLCIAFLLLWVVLEPKTLVGRVLNWAPVRHMGMISYSLYLWQQLFDGRYQRLSNSLMLVAIVLCAEGSFWIVERPSLRFRGWLEARLFRSLNASSGPPAVAA